MNVTEAKAKLDTYPECAQQWILSTAWFTHYTDESLTEQEVIKRAIKRMEQEAAKRATYRGPKAAQDAANLRECVEQLRSQTA